MIVKLCKNYKVCVTHEALDRDFIFSFNQMDKPYRLSKTRLNPNKYTKAMWRLDELLV